MAAAAGHATTDEASELVGGTDGVGAALGDDLAGDASAESFFTELVDEVGEMLFAEPLEKLPGGLAAGAVEAEVERPSALEAEAALVVGELIAGEAEVEEDAIDGGDF